MAIMIDTTDKPITEKITRPAKQWRNKWRTLKAFYAEHHNRVMVPGDEYYGTLKYPSKEEAELQAASCFLDSNFAAYHAEAEYLGAHPVTP